MRRFGVMVAVAAVVGLVGGCNRDRYVERQERFLADLKYDKDVKDNLMPPTTEKKFVDLAIYLQAPKEEALAKAGMLSVADGQFDLDASFADKSDAFLHVLARVKQAKKAPTKGAAPAPVQAPRGVFNDDVKAVLTNQGFEVSDAKPARDEQKRVGQKSAGNQYDRLGFKGAGKEGRLYSFKNGNHEVALIFVYDPKLKNEVSHKIDLCLQKFAVGPVASKRLSGGGGDEAEAGPAGPL